jgi:hypothetical protein
MAVIMIAMRMIVVMVVMAFVTLMIMMAQFGRLLFIAMMFKIMGVNMAFARFLMIMLVVIVFMMTVFMIVMIMLMRLFGVGRILRILARALDHGALHAIAMAAAARIAMARTAAVGAVFALFLGLAMGALIGFDQRLPVGDRDLVIVGMDFAEGQEAVPVAAILDEGGLQRRLYAGHLGEVDIAAQLLALGGLEVKLFDAIAADHNDPGLFRVGGVDQHFVGHFGTHGGGGRVWRRARIARPGDATVHLIRG